MTVLGGGDGALSASMAECCDVGITPIAGSGPRPAAQCGIGCRADTVSMHPMHSPTLAGAARTQAALVAALFSMAAIVEEAGIGRTVATGQDW